MIIKHLYLNIIEKYVIDVMTNRAIEKNAISNNRKRQIIKMDTFINSSAYSLPQLEIALLTNHKE